MKWNVGHYLLTVAVVTLFAMGEPYMALLVGAGTIYDMNEHLGGGRSQVSETPDEDPRE